MGYDVCVVGGLGHVGLPLGIMLARGGKRVVLYDINTEAIDMVSKGKMPFLENGAEEILSQVIDKNLFVSNDRGVITESHYVIIVIGTPVDKHLNPQFTIFKQFFDDLSDCLRDGQHIILRSTVFPGTTEKIKEYLAAKGKSIRVSFCPERIAEGKAVVELRALPQIVASFDSGSEQEAASLFGTLTDDILYLAPIEAELAKLFTNVWRYIQFSISNQFYQIAEQHNLDFYKIFDAIKFKYPRASSFPSAGFAAGPCLFKDTMQLAAFSNNSFFLGHAAMLINEGLPNFIVSTLKDRHCLKDKTVGILGMAFKANNDDKRESLSYKVKKIMEIEAKHVLCSDVYINDDGFVTAETLISGADIIVLGTPHKEYAALNIPKDKVMVDVWNFFGNGGLF
ncbi:MAG: nucleotide sugar dehydrogenase [Nitrospirae bacterium]|nr:nucleotide sugar dehydrogenase [Nitrospirota bacterium]